MEKDSVSVSNNQNVVPYLPPLVINDISIEIQYYKQLAVAVKERLTTLEAIKKHTSEKSQKNYNKDNLEFFSNNSKNSYSFDCKSGSDNSSQDTLNNSSKDQFACLIDIENGLFVEKNIKIQHNFQQTNFNYQDCNFKLDKAQLQQTDQTILNEEKNCPNDIIQDDITNSDTIITDSTDLNQYLNTSISIKTTDTTETTPENQKPEVPKSLDIVPITIDNPKLLDVAFSNDIETPKLVRQGSYILDRPSPVLVAHIQNEILNKSSTLSNMIKQEDWSSNTVDLKDQTNIKTTSSRPSLPTKYRKNNHFFSQRACKSVSNSQNGSPMDIYKTKSADCIQSIFAKEFYSNKITNNKINHRKHSSVNSVNVIKKNGLKTSNKITPILNLADNFSDTSKNINQVSKPVSKSGKKNVRDFCASKSMYKNFIMNSEPSIEKPRPKETSEKLVSVFKEVQNTYKKQMLELMVRQQQEKMQMQENFKKQQILLLAEIRKAFPEISISALKNAMLTKISEHTDPNKSSSSSNSAKSKLIQKEDSIKLQLNSVNNHKKKFQESKYNYTTKDVPSNSCYLEIQPQINYNSIHRQVSQIFENSPTKLMSHLSIDDMPVGTSIRRLSTVSRQLFSSDNKNTKASSVFNNSLYSENHIKATIKINAYARGFLVRRLMKTEKIKALKNIYKEALHCMLRLHVDAPLNLPELNLHQRLQLQCDAASMNIVDIFSQSSAKRMEIIAHDREIKKIRSVRPSSARSYSFATQRTLARKKIKEYGSD